MSLLIWLPLNGNLNNLGLKDITVTNNGATVNNSGKIGKCYSFDGTNDYLSFSYNIADIVCHPWSFACWAKFNDVTGNATLICSRKSTGTGMAVFKLGTGFRFDNGSDTVGSQNNFSSYFTCAANTWYHLVFIHTENQKKFYVNGTLIYETATNFPLPASNSTLTVTIGGSGSNGVADGNWLNGYLNDIRFYDHALSDKEIEELSKGLVLHYKLDYSNPNLLSKYVSPGLQAPGITTTAGRTQYGGDYAIIIPATENADTYFRLYTTEQLVENTVYTLSCWVSGLLEGSYYRFPLFSQSNSSMGVLHLDNNGLCSLTFTMNSTVLSTDTIDGITLYRCFMDDSNRNIALGQGPITVSNFKLEKGSVVSSWCSSSENNSIIYDTSGYGNNGTIIGTLTANSNTPKYNVSTLFGTSSTIAAGRGSMVKDAISICCWGYLDNWSDYASSKRMISCTEGGGWNFETSSGKILFPVGTGTSSNTYKTVVSTTTLASLTSGWHFFVGTYDGLVLKLYIDGILENTTTAFTTKTPIYYHTSNGIFIGAEASSSQSTPAGSYFNNLISDVRIYATALSDKLVKELYDTSVTIDNKGNVYAREVVEV